MSNLQINSNGDGSYAVQLSAPSASIQTTDLTPATPAPVLASPAPAFGGNTQLSRALLAANAAPQQEGLQSIAPTAFNSTLVGTIAPSSAAPVSFAQTGFSGGGGGGFGFTNYIKNPSSLASLALFPVRYFLGSRLNELILLNSGLEASGDASNNCYTRSVYSDEESAAGSELVEIDNESLYFRRASDGAYFSDSREMANLAMDPAGPVSRNSEVIKVSRGFEEFANVESVGLGVVTGGSGEETANIIFATPAQSDFTLSGAYGGLLAGRGGYTVVNFSTFRYGKPAVDSSQSASLESYRIQRTNISGGTNEKFGKGYSPGWKIGQGLAGSFKTVFQYSRPGSSSSATTLIGFNAQQSLGWNLLAHKSKLFDSGARFSLDLSLIAGFVMEQRYTSANGLSRALGDTGLAVGGIGDAIRLAQTTQGIAAGAMAGAKGDTPDLNNTSFNGLGNPLKRRYSSGYIANAGGIASLGLAVEIPVGVAASQMNADGTYSFGLGLQENVRARLLSKYGIGLEVIAGAQQNLLWTLGEGFANPSLQALAFASVGASLPWGVFIPIIPNATWVYNSPTSSSTQTAALAASQPATDSKGLYI